MVTSQTLEHLNPQALRELALRLMLENQEHKQVIAQSQAEIEQQKKELLYRQTKIDQLTHEMAISKRWRFGQQSERLDPAQASLLEETLDTDIAAMESEMEVKWTRFSVQ